jgi:DNA helicase-2/ATP-dependent DNA helicase PcrA
LCYSKSRYRWGQLIDCVPSRFIGEIDPRYIASSDDKNESDVYENKSFGSIQKKQIGNSNPSTKFSLQSNSDGLKGKKRLIAEEKDENQSDETEIETTDIKLGSKVHHDRFGIGIVKDIEGEFPNTKAKIDFETTGTKQLLLKFAKLTVIR